MPTFLLRVRGALDPEDSQAPVFLDVERDEIEIGDLFPSEGEEHQFRASDGHVIEFSEIPKLRCVDRVVSGYYGSMLIVERIDVEEALGTVIEPAPTPPQSRSSFEPMSDPEPEATNPLSGQEVLVDAIDDTPSGGPSSSDSQAPVEVVETPAEKDGGESDDNAKEPTSPAERGGRRRRKRSGRRRGADPKNRKSEGESGTER